MKFQKIPIILLFLTTFFVVIAQEKGRYEYFGISHPCKNKFQAKNEALNNALEDLSKAFNLEARVKSRQLSQTNYKNRNDNITVETISRFKKDISITSNFKYNGNCPLWSIKSFKITKMKEGYVAEVRIVLTDCFIKSINKNKTSVNKYSPSTIKTKPKIRKHIQYAIGLEKTFLNFISHGDLDSRDSAGLTIMHYAAMKNLGNIVYLLWERKPDLINAKDNMGETPLHLACENGALFAAEKLIEYKADINAQDIDGETPLHYACRKGKKDIIVLLIKNGANITVKNSAGKTPGQLLNEYCTKTNTCKDFKDILDDLNEDILDDLNKKRGFEM